MTSDGSHEGRRRIVLAPAGTRGDVEPMIALGRVLRGRGHDVVLSASPSFARLAADHEIPFCPSGMDMQTWLGGTARDVTQPCLRNARAALGMLSSTVEAQFRALAPVCDGADLLLGAGLQFAGASIAEALGIRYRFVAYTPQSFESTTHAPPILPWALPAATNRVAWFAWRRFVDGTLLPSVNRERRALGLGPLGELWRHSTSLADPLLACDRALFGAPIDAPPGLVQTGAWHLQAAEALGPDLEAFLQAGEVPVYVGFGSMPDSDPARTTGLVLDALRVVGRRVVLARGWAGLGVARHVGREAHIVDAAPHHALFARVAVAVHHGGAGTTAAAARAGIPQIVVPHLGDQRAWGERVRALGVGPPPILRASLTAASLVSALQAALEDPAMSERARALAGRLHSVSGVDDAVALILRSLDRDSTSARRAPPDGRSPVQRG